MPAQAISELNAYMGIARQSAQGVSAAPSTFFRWLDGSSYEPARKVEDVREGDGSRRLSRALANQQYHKAKIVVDARPNEFALLMQAALGHGSDAYTAAAVSTTQSGTTLAVGATVNLTLNASVAAGASTLTTLANTGFPATGVLPVVIDGGTNVQEIVVLTLPGTGTGPYTYTIANTGTLQFAHAAGATVKSTAGVTLTATTGIPGSGTVALALSQGTANEEIVLCQCPAQTSTLYALSTGSQTVAMGAFALTHTAADAIKAYATHVLTDQTIGDYWSVEVSMGGTAGYIYRIVDAQVDQIKISAKAGMQVQLEVDFVGCTVLRQTTAATVSFENHLPFLFQQSASYWTLDGVTTGDAPYVSSFALTLKNAIDLIQTEHLTLDALLYTTVTVDCSFAVLFQNGNRYNSAYLGNISGTSDAQQMATGSLLLSFVQPTGFFSNQLSAPNLVYTKVSGADKPKTAGKHLEQTLEAASISNNGVAAYVVQDTLQTMQYAALN